MKVHLYWNMKDCLIHFTSKQSFFLCVMAPQFSQAPLRNFVETEFCLEKKKRAINLEVYLQWLHEGNSLIHPHLLHSSLVPLSNG